MFMRMFSTQVTVCANGNQPRFLSFLRVSSSYARLFYARSRISIPQLSPRIMRHYLYSIDTLGKALVTLLLKGNSRVGHLLSEKPCKCFSYCNTIKKYIFNDLFGSEIKFQSVEFAAYSIFRH